MGFLDSFERSVERAVGGSFAKAFASGVHPVEIVAALKRETDARAKIVSRTRTLAPHHFHVKLSPIDCERLHGLGDAFVGNFLRLFLIMQEPVDINSQMLWWWRLPP